MIAPWQDGGEMKRVAKPKDDAITETPSDVLVRPARNEPQPPATVTLDAEHVRVAVRVGPLLYRYLLYHHPLNTLRVVFYL